MSFDLRTTIAERPWQTIALAFGAGAWLALVQPRTPRSAIARSLLAGAGSIAIGVARDLATRRMLAAARAWLDDRFARARPS